MIITADTVCKKSDQHNERLTALLDRFKALTIDVCLITVNDRTYRYHCIIMTIVYHLVIKFLLMV